MQGTFTNTTPIKATFTAAGDYTIKLSLINVANSNAVITTNTFTVNVSEEAQAPTNNVINNNTNTSNNTIEELPQTGIGIGDYLIFAFILMFIGTLIYFKLRKKNN